jgi:membrane protease YdiL (CAAX protease family)
MAGLGLVTAALALAGAMAILLLSQWIMVLLDVPPVQQSSIEALRQTNDVTRRVGIAVMAIVLAPLFEETLFRGILYPALKQAGYPRLALWGTAVLFGLSHMNALTFLSLTFIGLLLALLYERTDNLLAPIFAHMAFNGANYAWVVLMQSGG